MYMLFAGESYYASGGVNDLVGCYESSEEAIKLGKELKDKKVVFEKYDFDPDSPRTLEIEWFHVYSVKNKRVIASEGSAHACDYGISSAYRPITIVD